MKPTDEQQAIIDATKTGENGVGEALAGTGKTTVSNLVCRARPRVRIKYLAYNRSARDEAKKKFPRNAHVLTTHGLAFGPVGVKYKDRIFDMPRQYGRQQAAILGIKEGVKVGEMAGEDVYLSPSRIASVAMETVQRYCYSNDRKIERKHVPYVNGCDKEGMNALAEFVLRYANHAWEDMISPKGRLSWNKSHDPYLKIYALTDPQIETEFIIVDEAQDSNPCVTGLLEKQDCQIMLVGDRNQQIYAWRGAVDAMQDFDAAYRKALTMSFRFGHEVAIEANKWLTILESPNMVRGFDQIESIRVDNLEDPNAVLCRTNAQTVAEAMAAVEKGRSYAFVGDIAYEINRFAEAAQRLQQGIQPDHPDLGSFKSWQQVREFVNEEGGGGADLKVYVDLIDNYGVPMVMQLANGSVNEQYADVTLSTAHKAKGREWDKVRIAPDFREPLPDETTGEPGQISKEDAMLAYVAVTRAQKVLDPTGLAWVDKYIPHADDKPVEPEPEGLIPRARRKSRKRRKEKLSNQGD